MSGPCTNSSSHAHVLRPQATSPGPVCPQRFPEIGDEADALYRMPLARLRALQYLRPRLLRQSEDCLYLNLFVPRMPQTQTPTQRQQRGGGRGEWTKNNIFLGNPLLSL